MNALAPGSDYVADLIAIADAHGYVVSAFRAGDRWQAVLKPKDGGDGFRHASKPQLGDAMRGVLALLPKEATHA